ncbi:hypothetical protein D3C74_488680 [compost metagenome]
MIGNQALRTVGKHTRGMGQKAVNIDFVKRRYLKWFKYITYWRVKPDNPVFYKLGYRNRGNSFGDGGDIMNGCR